MTLQQLKYVAAVADNKSINKAATSLFITQPSLSGAIKELENEIGIQIFIRSSRGILLTAEGEEFLGYARQMLEYSKLIDDRYIENRQLRKKFSVSTQHYSFAVNAFVDVIREYDADAYSFILRETQTYEIIDDVAVGRSEIGILYLSEHNEAVLSKLINKNDLNFEELYVAKPHVFISNNHPLADKDEITIQDLMPYPYLVFEQGKHNSFYFSEEFYSP